MKNGFKIFLAISILCFVISFGSCIAFVNIDRSAPTYGRLTIFSDDDRFYSYIFGLMFFVGCGAAVSAFLFWHNDKKNKK